MNRVLVAAFAALAVADWVSVARGWRSLEYVFKPSALAALIVLAASLDASNPTQQTLFLVALLASLAGDVFLMLPRDLFIAGLGAFLMAHVLYGSGLALAGASGSTFAAGVVVMALIGAFPLRRVMAGLTGRRRALRVPVAIYSLVISTMVATAFASGDRVALAGALLFYFSDLCIAWSRFVADFPTARVLIMVTYHTGQFALVWSLSA